MTFLARRFCFPSDRSCDDTPESIFFQSWTFSCSHNSDCLFNDQTKVFKKLSLVLELYWKNKIDCDSLVSKI